MNEQVFDPYPIFSHPGLEYSVGEPKEPHDQPVVEEPNTTLEPAASGFEPGRRGLGRIAVLSGPAAAFKQGAPHSQVEA